MPKDIYDMSDEELMMAAAKKLALFFAIKWGLIFGVTYVLKKWAKSLPDK